MVVLNYILGAGLAISMFYAAGRNPDGLWLRILISLCAILIVLYLSLPRMLT